MQKSLYSLITPAAARIEPLISGLRVDRPATELKPLAEMYYINLVNVMSIYFKLYQTFEIYGSLRYAHAWVLVFIIPLTNFIKNSLRQYDHN
jgi:hypothetical protein